MADKIRANYPAMEEMAKHLETVDNRLGELMSSVSKIVEQLNGGVLQGQPGDALASALSLLVVKIMDLGVKIDETRIGIRAAISDMQQADSSAAGDFK